MWVVVVGGLAVMGVGGSRWIVIVGAGIGAA